MWRNRCFWSELISDVLKSRKLPEKKHEKRSIDKKTYWEKKWSFIIGKSWSIFMPNTFLKKNWSVLSISQLKAFGVYGVSLLLTIALVKMKAIWSWNVTISRSHEQCFIEPCPASDIQKNLVKLAPYHVRPCIPSFFLLRPYRHDYGS